MITLRLFKAADPFQQVEARPLDEGEVSIGRDPASGWAINDSSGALSRRHCVVEAADGRLWLTDTSTNGVFIGIDRRRAPRGERCELGAGDTLYLGDFMILLDAEAANDLVLESAPVAVKAPPARAPVSAPVTDAALLEAFCHGAELEASSFAGEDPAAVLQRLGVIYRQVIEDLCSLMSDRAMLKNALQLERTTISARDNNPLKWASPQRVAVDLLREDERSGFLTGAAAFESSFADLRRHGACLLAGSRAAVQGVLDDLDPDKLDGAKKQSLNFSRYETAWKQFQARHAQLLADAGARGAGRVERLFREGYEAQLKALEATGEAA